jgi:hypothetical protein
MTEIQALEWVQGQISYVANNKVTKDWPTYNR